MLVSLIRACVVLVNCFQPSHVVMRVSEQVDSDIVRLGPILQRMRMLFLGSLILCIFVIDVAKYVLKQKYCEYREIS